MNAVLIFIMAVTLGSAALAMVQRNLIHSALIFIFNWAGIAAFYLWAGADFVAFAQILVYVGAVSMVVLFAVLLTRRTHGEMLLPPETTTRLSSALLTAGAVGGVLTGAILGTRLDVPTTAAPVVTVKQLGQELMGPQVAGLLVVGVILTVALLGAVVIASLDQSTDKEEAS